MVDDDGMTDEEMRQFVAGIVAADAERRARRKRLVVLDIGVSVERPRPPSRAERSRQALIEQAKAAQKAEGMLLRSLAAS